MVQMRAVIAERPDGPDGLVVREVLGAPPDGSRAATGQLVVLPRTPAT